MASIERKKNKEKAEGEAEAVVSMEWQDKKELANKEEESLRKDIEDLNTWVNMIETMNNKQLKGYLENCPADSKMTKGQKIMNKVQSTGKSKSSTSNGIMASVWKFHKK